MIENKNRNQEEDKSIAVAEESREANWKSKSFMASMFMGDLDVSMCFPFPDQEAEDKASGDEGVAKEDGWCAENVDGEEIDRTGEIPASVMRGLADLGLFGIKILTKYGGLGLSQTNYMRILTAAAATVAPLPDAERAPVHRCSAPEVFGTEEQKQKFASPCEGCGECVRPDRALCRVRPGPDEDDGGPHEDGKHWIINGEKLWCTNGVIADLYVVRAATPPIMKRGKEVKQITASSDRTPASRSCTVVASWASRHRERLIGLRT